MRWLRSLARCASVRIAAAVARRSASRSRSAYIIAAAFQQKYTISAAAAAS